MLFLYMEVKCKKKKKTQEQLFDQRINESITQMIDFTISLVERS
jgi:hypothetical protein